MNVDAYMGPHARVDFGAVLPRRDAHHYQVPPGKAIEVGRARLIVSDIDISQPIPPNAAVVSFQVLLRTGKTRLQALFTNDEGESQSAYYVYVKRLL